ncbi:hypothetical protein ACFIJ5_00220 [Haloimpatiens sp. FM7330]|uniref:hypothetical protein n=1 Tax=Haloimpatiens sp. FM7330 TaxID=3298610 RepID=UPI0036377635
MKLFKEREFEQTFFFTSVKKYYALRRMNSIIAFLIFIPIIVSSIKSIKTPYLISYCISAIFIYGTWIFERTTKSIILEEGRFFIIIQVLLHSFFGTWLGFYSRFNYYDDILHILGGICLAVVIFPYVLGEELIWSNRKNTFLIYKVNIIIYGLVNTLGVFWEIGEFCSDLIFKKYPGYRLAQEGSLFDTMTDLIYDNIGAIIGICILWRITIKLNKQRNMSEVFKKLVIPLREIVNTKVKNYCNEDNYTINDK